MAATKLVSVDEIRQLWAGGEDALAELWVRRAGGPGLRDVEAARIEVLGGWLVWYTTDDISRLGAPEEVFLQRLAGALRSVAGVTGVTPHERRTWLVTGTPSGETLIRAAAAVVDEAAREARAGTRPG